MMLAELLASMKDSNGRVTVKLWWCDSVKFFWKSGFIRSSFCEQMKTELGMGNPEMKDIALSRSNQFTITNINGMQW
jgi:hypothetical protein